MEGRAGWSPACRCIVVGSAKLDVQLGGERPRIED